MSARRRIAVVTGSRADYGLLRPVLGGIAGHPNLELQLLVTGSHLSERHGRTIEAILADSLHPAAQIDLALSADSAHAVSQAMGRGVTGFADALEELQPDLVLVLGDRYEILAAAQAALIARIPLAHIAGGDLTEGAFDDAIRHAVSKMAHLHCVTNAAARRRLLQMGEEPWRVRLTGSPGIDQLLATPLLGRAELEQSLGLKLGRRCLAITFHPPTLDTSDALDQLETLLSALERLGPDTALVFTGANADPRGDSLNRRLRAFVANHANAVWHASLGQQRYYSLVKQADAVVGNSSSGLYEAPSLGTPTVNLGSRQDGRLRAASVIDCPVELPTIVQAVHRAYTLGCKPVENPYGDGRAAGRIVEFLAEPREREALLHKRFQDLAIPT